MESHGVFVGDLSYFATEQDLIQLFSPFGPIDSVMIRRGKSGDTLHYGFVKMNEVCAQTAISTLQGYKFMGRKLRYTSFIQYLKIALPKYSVLFLSCIFSLLD